MNERGHGLALLISSTGAGLLAYMRARHPLTLYATTYDLPLRRLYRGSYITSPDTRVPFPFARPRILHGWQRVVPLFLAARASRSWLPYRLRAAACRAKATLHKHGLCRARRLQLPAS